MQPRIRIAVQKSGRLHDSTMKLLKECGLEIGSPKRLLRSPVGNFPAEALFLRDDDIPQYVEDKVADIGIVGENEAAEKQRDVETIERLGFAKCRLSLAVPKGDNYSSIMDLNGKKIATSYPNILRKALEKAGVQAEIHEISGSVEIAPGIGLADAICDLVSTGSTLISNGLREVETVMRSEAVMIANKSLNSSERELVDQLRFRIQSVQRASRYKYVLLNAPNEQVDVIASLLPGMRSPTVLPLREAGWSSVHTVIEEGDFWKVIEQLKAAGAQGILVAPIEKMVL